MMGGLKIGVFVESFRLGVRPGIERAAELGVPGFQVFTTKGEMAPENMSPAKRKEFKQFVASRGLEISATCADFGKGLVDPEVNEEIVPRVKAAVDLASDLEVGIITTHIGVVPDDENDPAWAALVPALNDIGRYAEPKGVTLATETGPEEGSVLRRLLDKLDTKAIAANFDPANLVMKGFDHMQAVEDLVPFIVHTHAKDGKRGNGEVPLGEGDVDFPPYIEALRSHGYAGYFTVERECGDDPETDIRNAVDFLRTL
jgi:L-ribulose-5-phosphate 3-epimerase